VVLDHCPISLPDHPWIGRRRSFHPSAGNGLYLGCRLPVMTGRILALLPLLFVAGPAFAQNPGAKPSSAPAPSFFTTRLSASDMAGKQAVLVTSMGEIVIDLLPEAAPNHVGHFIELAREGAYDGTTFHRAVKMGIVQGGDPLSKDPLKREQYGTGGLGKLRAEPNAEKHTRGAVSAVLAGNDANSGGAQFFISVVDQPALDGRYTVFARVSEGIRIVEKISAAPVDDRGRIVDRLEIRSVAIRDKPPAGPEPFSTESIEELERYQAVLETSMGEIAIGFLPAKAPNHVRNFLRLASAGVYDGTAFHRVAKGFVIQTGFMPSRTEPLGERQERWVRNLAPEFNDTTHVKGIVSMARGDDPNSASTSFFVVTAPSAGLDGKYTAFGRVVSGIDVVEAIEAVPVDGETPRTRVDLKRVRVEKK
jgi:peptidyl-prolyl cis-trans isomerase B (cyclophilin B)